MIEGFKVVNIVASASLNTEIDLFSLALNVDNVEYEPEQFPGAILRISEPRASLLVFKNGNIICTGNKHEEKIPEVIRKTIEIIKNAQPGLNLPDPKDVKYEIVNIVASAELKVTVDLYTLAATMDNVEYEPEQFPGAIIRLSDPKATVLLFKNGKLICAGAKGKDVILKAIEKVKEIISEYTQ